MLRRGSIRPEQVPETVDHYLESGLKIDGSYHRVNLALCLAQGFQYPQDWLRADEVLSGLGASGSEVAGWWHSLANDGDPEGELVLGWLTRLNLIPDPDGIPFAQRLSRAKERGWEVPDWMFSPVLEGPPA